MRLLPILALVACTGSAPSTPDRATAPAGPASDGAPDGAASADTDRPMNPKERFLASVPAQGVPDPGEVLPLAQVAWPGNTWTLSDGRVLTIGEGTATLGEAPLSPVELSAHGGTVGPHHVQALTPCQAVVWDPPALLGATRTEPACPEADLAYADPTWRFATVKLAGGDFYTFLPEGIAWRHGRKRAFTRPRGTWTGEAFPLTVVFGPSTFEVHKVGGCAVAFRHDTGRVVRGYRHLPDCTAAERSYDGWAWTVWSLPDDTRLSLQDGPDAGKLSVDRMDQVEPIVGTWSAAGDVVSLAGDGRYRQIAREGCTATVTRADGTTMKAKRTFPRCGPPPPPRPPED
jgi:hypothetical protein